MAEEYRRGTHSIFRLHVHLCWCTKYRKVILVGDVANRMRDLTRQICADMGGRNTFWSSFQGSRTRADIDAAADFNKQAGTEGEGKNLIQDAARVCRITETVLGPTNVGERLLCVYNR